MTNDEAAQLLTDFEKRLAVVAAQAQKALALVKDLREDVARIRKALVSASDTQEYTALPPPKKPGRK